MPFPAGMPDPRTRTFVMPTRIVWTSAEGVAEPDHLLQDDDTVCVLRTERVSSPAGVLLDFGVELHGGVRIETPTISTGQRVRARIRFGESVSEAMGEPNNDHAIHDFETHLPWFGHAELGNTGFRFVRIDILEPGVDVSVRRVRAVFLYRPLDYVGSFECSDERLNRIWQTGAYTVHLCMQDHLWDGIKRDRLVWLGDLHPETMVVSTVFGDCDVVRESLDYVRDRTPLPAWMNGISSYSLWWIQCHRDWYRYHGNRDYLREQREYLLPLLERLQSRIAPDGEERLDGHRFLDWPSSTDPRAVDLGLQGLLTLALRSGAEICRALGETQAAEQALSAAERTGRRRRPPCPSKQANAIAVLAGMEDPVATNRDILARDPTSGVSTFYGYYVLQARALAGDHTGALDLIRRFWGAMLDFGATTFWEDFNLDWTANAGPIDELVQPGKADLHADFGDFCYKGLRHSLCHGWAAGPTAWLTEHVLGLAPASPGFETVRVRPNLAGLDWARGAIPTPHGPLSVEHRAGADGTVHTEIDAPAGVRALPE